MDIYINGFIGIISYNSGGLLLYSNKPTPLRGMIFSRVRSPLVGVPDAHTPPCATRRRNEQPNERDAMFGAVLRVLCVASLVSGASASSWSERQKLTASDRASNDIFGPSVSVSGDYAVVGAVGDDSVTGSAYIFVRSGTTWTQQQKLTASDAASGDLFGSSVSVSGGYAVVGAPYNDDGGSDSGSAYVFVMLCDASTAPTNGGVGSCTNSLASGSTCQPTCNSGYTVSGTSSCSAGTLTAATCSANACLSLIHI